MTLGGRPKERGGHKSLNISIDKEISQALRKVGNKSVFIENTIRPVLRQMDPGPACKVLRSIDRYLIGETVKAVRQKDFEKATALIHMAESLKEYRHLCRK